MAASPSLPVLALSALSLLSLLLSPADAKVVRYELNVTYGFASPDCVLKQVLLINGEYPGPTISGVQGDTMVVTLRNMLTTDGLTMHWHGIRQLGTNLMDGTAYVTQCPIEPLDALTYTFVLEKAGTYMYHGHLDSQVRAGLYGQLIVYEPPWAPLPYKYDSELGVLLSDWWHRSVTEQVAGLDSIPFVWIGEAQSLLLNGRGEYNCSLVPPITNPITGDAKTCNASSPDCAIEVFDVEYGKTYRLRIASITGLASLNLAIEGHTMTVIMADGYAVKPYVLGPEGLDIYAGQTVDVLVKANKPVGNYWVRIAQFGRPLSSTVPFGKAVLRYKGAPEGRPATAPPPVRAWNDTRAAFIQAISFKGLMAGRDKYGQVPPVPLFPGEVPGSPKMPEVPGQSPVVLFNAQQMVQGRIRWALNNISLVLPPVPYAHGIGQPRYDYLYKPDPRTTPFTPWNISLPAPTDAQYGSGYYRFELNSTVDIVLQNSNNLAPGTYDYHPWHMHGHQFWVMGYGFGTFQSSDHRTLNFKDPPFRNTAAIPPYGWVAIRFVVDNPGAWLFHCHISSHLHMGMAVIIVDGHTLPVPKGVQRCGLAY